MELSFGIRLRGSKGLPDTFDFSVVSDNQAYKCLGNGWTVDVIAWLLEAIKTANTKE